MLFFPKQFTQDLCGRGGWLRRATVLTITLGFSVIGLTSNRKISDPPQASYIATVPSEAVRGKLAGRFRATTNLTSCSCDVIIICVPTPLTKNREPDLKYIEDTGRTIAGALRRGQLVVLESTTYPGTTDEVLRPLLEESGLKSGTDFYIGFSPEREDPGNANFQTVSIPKVVSGGGAQALELMCAFYGAVVQKIVPVSTTATAEATKLS
jgi:UDP-N-acetyl-D-glucosamine dehydrogenase